MDEALRSRLNRWFATVELDDAVPPAVVVCLGELVEMLDTVVPSRVDPRRSAVRGEGHGWTVKSGVEIHLVHDTDEEADIRIAIGSDDAVVAWLSGHEHAFAEDGDDAQPWTTVAVDVVAAAIRGEYEVENHHRGGRLTKTRIVYVADPLHRRIVSTTGSLLGWLPWPGRNWVESQRVDYGPRRASRGPAPERT